MNVIKTLYKAARGILFSAIIVVVALYLIIYILLSVPSFQNTVKGTVEKELSALIGSKVEIKSLDISPFNEVMARGISVYDLKGEKCLDVEALGGGIRLWRLLSDRKIEFNYVEIIGLDASIVQEHKDSALNIQFIIDAFKPKDKNKPPTKFDLNLHNVVLRRCAVSFDREWIPMPEDRLKTDFNHLRITDLKADINLPKISNDEYIVDLRRLSFYLSGGLKVETIAFKAHLTQQSLQLSDILVRLPDTEIAPADLSLRFDGLGNIMNAVKHDTHRLVMVDNTVTLSDFAWLLPELRRYQTPLSLSVEAVGNAEGVVLDRFSLDSGNGDIDVDVVGEAANLADKEKTEIILKDSRIAVSASAVAEILNIVPGVAKKADAIIRRCGGISVSVSCSAVPYTGMVEADCHVATLCGDLYVAGTAHNLKKGAGSIKAEVSTEKLNLGTLLGDARFGETTADVIADVNLRGRDADGMLNVYVSDFVFDSAPYAGVAAEVEKDGKDINGVVTVSNDIADAKIDIDSHLEGEESWLELTTSVKYFHPSMLGLLPKYKDYTLSGMLNASLTGNNVDNIAGEVRLTDVSFFAPEQKSVQLDHLILKAATDDMERTISLKSDWADGKIRGNFKVEEVKDEVMYMLGKALPGILPYTGEEKELRSDVEFELRIKPDNTLTEFFGLPVRLLVDVPVKGSVDGTGHTAALSVGVPYIQQGKNKLVKDTRLNVELEGESSVAKVSATTTFPAKKGDMRLTLNVIGQNDNIFADMAWESIENKFLSGALSLGAEVRRDEFTSRPEVLLDINPSVFEFGEAKWNIDRSRVSYDDGILTVDGLKIWHGTQFVDIEGIASSSPLDVLTVKLADIDVGYIFDTLNINYVTFGGTATGELNAWGAFSPAPVAKTDSLAIKALSYNGAVLGDGIIKSHWDNDEKEVTIQADIAGEGDSHSVIDGGIWVTRDSLSFDIDANRVPVGFLAPFMSAFSSDVKGHASGYAKLYGTFSDIDLTGRILADSVALKLDYTNVYYHGTDSVFLNPGKIVIPSFRLYDRNGNSAILTGELTHHYFHEPRFNFRISDARRLLCYDTNAKMNPDWYGTFYGNGNAVVRGWPGAVSVSVDMTAVGQSNFTFVLNDTQAAEDYRFLTFSDRKKEAAEKLRADSISPILSVFQKKIEAQNDSPSKFMMDIRGTVTPSTLMTLVMDPVAGDKITARGNGNIQVDYDSESDEMQMFGKYILEEGNYNFSLQDLILRDFNIRQGSSISFNGDPFNAQLDITASYRVNTNLSDLDKSFSTDRDLARTNVPVDAVLMVDGEMQHPDITFDIELPTLTQDVERKVKSIISTDDMMSRQIIYLLALNRFYTPEYMGSTSNGGELASVASSTLSSQLSNMLGQLTDKFTVAPSFRSDKGDFSDIEVDVALSSRLLNNRLLVNGNFGYRDRSTSQTTFVGDFDIEYLLSRSGNLRLKAYNHFNDQNYYLRQALTTQGLGVIYRKDFDNPFTFLKRRKKNKPAQKSPVEAQDSLKALPKGKNPDSGREAKDSLEQNANDSDTLLRFK